MFKQSDLRSKKKVPLSIEMKDGVSFDGHLFLANDQRLSDLVNDDRLFFPFERSSDGKLMLIAKDSVRVIFPKEAKRKNLKVNSEDPYQVLGVSRDLELEEIRKIYRARAQEFHPDRFSHEKFPQEIIEFANDMMSKINQAFQSIRDERAEARRSA